MHMVVIQKVDHGFWYKLLDGNLVHELAEIVGNKNFDVFGKVLDVGTEAVESGAEMVAGAYPPAILVSIAAKVANLAINYCLERYKVTWKWWKIF